MTTNAPRVFDDNTGHDATPFWFEVKPDDFRCANSWEQALRSADEFVEPIPEETLRGVYGDRLTDVTAAFPSHPTTPHA